MARVECPDCGFVHEYDPHGSGISKKEQKGDKKDQGNEDTAFTMCCAAAVVDVAIPAN